MMALWERDIDGVSMLSEMTHVDTISLHFYFDGDILGSQPYRSAHRSDLRRGMVSAGTSAAGRAGGQEAPPSVRHPSALSTVAEGPTTVGVEGTPTTAASGNTWTRSFKDIWLARARGPGMEAGLQCHREIEDQLRKKDEREERSTKVLILGTS